jgi:hypothetical protein
LAIAQLPAKAAPNIFNVEQKRVDEIADSILDNGLRALILVRADGARFVLVEGLHRLEAAEVPGEETIVAFLVAYPIAYRPKLDTLLGQDHDVRQP